MRARRLEHVFGRCCGGGADACGLGVRLGRRDLARSEQLDNRPLCFRLRDGRRLFGHRTNGTGRLFGLLRAAAENRFGLALHARGFVLRLPQQARDAVLAFGPDLGGGLAGRQENPHGFLAQ